MREITHGPPSGIRKTPRRLESSGPRGLGSGDPNRPSEEPRKEIRQRSCRIRSPSEPGLRGTAHRVTVRRPEPPLHLAAEGMSQMVLRRTGREASSEAKKLTDRRGWMFAKQTEGAKPPATSRPCDFNWSDRPKASGVETVGMITFNNIILIDSRIFMKNIKISKKSEPNILK